ncbi:hypothetical protein [Streptomyces sp. YIM 98790]|uniref:hypothetical protein n=1 Tax=Streptomyces sp. YIM 98790 TaxID=2689077 RepID=UPI00140983B1|nr:hypothetical protein [Streptomyces sp. YIM 98790]
MLVVGLLGTAAATGLARAGTSWPEAASFGLSMFAALIAAFPPVPASSRRDEPEGHRDGAA